MTDPDFDPETDGDFTDSWWKAVRDVLKGATDLAPDVIDSMVDSVAPPIHSVISPSNPDPGDDEGPEYLVFKEA